MVTIIKTLYTSVTIASVRNLIPNGRIWNDFDIIKLILDKTLNYKEYNLMQIEIKC